MEEPKFMVVAIDFGSSGAGCAFSYAYQYQNDPLDMYSSIWTDSSEMMKVPCVILFNHNGNFEAFGNKAETIYKDLVEQGIEEQWFFFKGFKMQLYTAVENDVVRYFTYHHMIHHLFQCYLKKSG